MACPAVHTKGAAALHCSAPHSTLEHGAQPVLGAGVGADGFGVGVGAGVGGGVGNGDGVGDVLGQNSMVYVTDPGQACRPRPSSYV